MQLLLLVHSFSSCCPFFSKCCLFAVVDCNLANFVACAIVYFPMRLFSVLIVFSDFFFLFGDQQRILIHVACKPRAECFYNETTTRTIFADSGNAQVSLIVYIDYT